MRTALHPEPARAGGEEGVASGESAIEYRFVQGDDPLMADVADLCYAVLHEPFGVSRDDHWDNLDPASTHLIALVGGRVVGYVRLISESGLRAHVRQLSVYPEWQRRGIGSALMTRVLERARESGLTEVYLNARIAAVGFYEQLSFVRVGGESPMARTYLPHVRMELRL